MNKRQLKKYRGWEGALPCVHLYKESQLLATDPIPYYQDEEYCKIKDCEVMEEKGVEEYEFDYCTRCRHYCPNRSEFRKLRNCIKLDERIYRSLSRKEKAREETVNESINFFDF